MAAVDVLNSTGEKVSEANLHEDIFNVPVKKCILHDVVRMQLAGKRQGTAKTKNRAEVTGSTSKLFRQKGTGNARAGDVKSPLRRGGGVIFGPVPKSYSIKIPKKVRSKAMKMALSSKLEDGELFVIDSFDLDQIKTKQFISILENLNLRNILIVTEDDDTNLFLSSRNVPDVKVIKTAGLNVYDILKYDNLLLIQPAIQGIERRLL